MIAPRVSVIIPTYNSAWSVGRTLLSIRHQTFADFEVIMVNDGSTDNLEDALAPFRADPRIRVVCQPNSGLAASRNRGISEAKAPLVAPIDADDLWHPDFLEATVSALEKDESAPFAFSYFFRMNENDEMLPFTWPSRPPRHDFIGLLSLNSVGCGSSAVYRRDLMLRFGGYDTEMGRQGLPGAEDWKLILQLAKLGEPIMIERLLTGYRTFAKSMSQSYPQRQQRAVLALIDAIGEQMPDLSRRILADARTMITAWLLPAYAKNRMVGDFIVQFLKAYVLNPFWFTNPLLRDAHYRWLATQLKVVSRRLNRKEAVLPHLSEVSFEGRLAFDYLPREAPDVPWRRPTFIQGWQKNRQA
ncbi:MAG: glycosyltransferase family 2 protein [Sphingobium sp.]